MSNANAIPPVGTTFEMKLDNFPGFTKTFKVVDLDVKDDSGGTIKLKVISDSQESTIHKGEYASQNVYDGVDKAESFSVVEEAWFTANVKRKIKILKD
jgi:hypothetical protein